VPGQHFEYGFDTIGNRTQTGMGGDAYGAGLLLASYTNNALNQLTGRGVPSYVDIVGAATALATNVSVNSQAADYRLSEYYWKKLAVVNSGGPVWPTVTNTAIMSNQAVTVTGHLLVPPAGQSFQYDADGNLTNDLVWRYKWDAENRLIEATNVTGLPADARRKVAFSYDYLGRRAAKWVFAWDSGGNDWAANPLVSVRFVYDQPSGQAGSWNLIAELDLIQNPGTPTLVRSYLWGTDLSGTFDKAGGVGGLLAITTHASPLNTHFTCFDGNGNVMGLVNSADKSVSARYEYGPFGEPIRVTGPLAQTNPFRFSTKFTDEETGLVYYGYRYYAPTLGRWINRDPLEEQGGLNLYALVSNAAPNTFDIDGRGDYNATSLSAGSGWASTLNYWVSSAIWRAFTAIYADLEVLTALGMYGGIRAAQIGVQGVGMAYNATMQLLASNPAIAYEAPGFFMAFMPGLPPGGTGGFIGGLVSYRNDVVRIVDEKFEAFMDYILGED